MIFDWIDEHKKLSVLTFIIIVLGFPLLVNQLSLWEAKCDVFGYPSDWLLFWGTYLAAIASFGMIIISAISIHHNSLENKANRDLQYNVIKYQTKQQWINQLKEAIVCALDAFDESIINEFLKKYNNHSNEQEFYNLYKGIENKLAKATNAIEMVLMGCNDSMATDFLDVFKEKKIRFMYYVDDIIYILQIPDNFQNKNGINNTEYFKQQMEIYKNNGFINPDSNPERIWEIAEKYNFRLIGNRRQILQDLHSYAKSYSFRKQCNIFIENEIKKTEQILVNGTEQDK